MRSAERAFTDDDQSILVIYCVEGLRPRAGWRCLVPGCEATDRPPSFTDFSPGLFPAKQDGSPDYCSFYQPVRLENGTCARDQFGVEHKHHRPRPIQAEMRMT